jgi:hypothetical protein
MDKFDEWWNREGQYLDPDTSDVPWFDKRRGLAEMAFNAAMAISGNYVSDDPVLPQRFDFVNGRAVWINNDGILETDRKTPTELAASPC